MRRALSVAALLVGAVVLAGPVPVREHDPRTFCPPGEGFRPLTSLHPTRAVVVGAAANSDLFRDRMHRRYVAELASLLERIAPHVVLVVGAERVGRLDRASGAGNELRELRSRANIRFIRGSSWYFQRDLFASGVFGPEPEPALFGHPADELLALAGARHVTDPSWTGHGGDIMAFPGGVVVHGSRTPGEFLDRGTGGRALAIRTEWLGVGHVDELFGLVPASGSGRCDFAVVHASPRLALDALARTRERDPAESAGPWPHRKASPFPDAPGPGHHARTCLDELPGIDSPFGTPSMHAPAKEVLGCAELVEANRRYEALIRRDLGRIVAAVEREAGCAGIPTIGLPVLFRPKYDLERYGSPDDRAHAFNPNPVNSLVIGRHVIAPWQPNPELEAAVRAPLQELGLTVHFIDTPGLLNGFVHCATNALRVCRGRDGRD